jgi:HSP20 family molecular chaperone IbpA
VDIVETADELTVSADLPGVKAEDVDINFDNGTMTIVGKAPNRRPEGTTPVLTEYGVGDFHRSFEVSEKIQADKISAEFAHGVLTLHLPKGEAIKPRKIALQTK